MSRLILFHGSPYVVEKPIFGKGMRYNDYGQGFYCTEHLEIAKEWACTEGINGFANRYEIETEGMKILNLSSKEYSVLNWLAILLKNRNGRTSSPVEKRGREYLLRHFLPEYESYDIILGYRADDSYFSFARAFVGNGISLKQLAVAMKLGRLGMQVVLKSQRAFDAIRFLDAIEADNPLYYAKRKERDDQAKTLYQKELENEDQEGIFIRDIIKERMKPGDERLQ